MEIRPLAERDVDEADRVFRSAFGTFLGLPDPMAFAGDADLVRPRWRAAPETAIGAYEDDRLIGSNFLTRWGSFGFFGPLTVRPEHWNKGVARMLLDATMARLSDWGVGDVGLFTFAHSPKHVGFYQKYGFWPQRLTAVMEKTITAAGPKQTATDADWRGSLQACRALTQAILPGLDLTPEIEALKTQGLGDLVLAEDGVGLAGFAVMHCGAGSESGSGVAYVKFAAARDGDAFRALLGVAETFVRARGLERLVAGVNTARTGAYRMMLDNGFRSALQGVAMQLHDRPGFNRPDCFVIDDWR